MKKVTVKNLIEFRRKNERTKITFVNNLKKEDKLNDNSGGGDYWVSCLSAISNTFKYDNSDLLDERIGELNERILGTDDKKVKDRHQKNIDILEGIKDFDFKECKPKFELKYHKQPKIKSIINIKGLPIEAKPRFIFSFTHEEKKEIGGIWFVAKLHGYTKIELGMFADMIYQYLQEHFSNSYSVNKKYCIAIDVTKGLEVNYSEIESGKIPSLINVTINELIKL